MDAAVYNAITNIRHYSLEVVQNPLRARMCGFGDKVRDLLCKTSMAADERPCLQDRRPLAPAAVAKMVVRGDDNSIVDVG